MTDHLLRQYAPIPATGWRQIDEEAKGSPYSTAGGAPVGGLVGANTDPAPPPRDNPLAPATRSEHAQRKTARHHDDTGTPLRSFRDLLEHMATLTRNTITLGQTTFDKITPPPPSNAPSTSSAPPSR